MVPTRSQHPLSRLLNGALPSVAIVVFACGVLWWKVEAMTLQVAQSNELLKQMTDRLTRLEERQAAMQSRIENIELVASGQTKSMEERVRDLEKLIRDGRLSP